MHPPAQASQAPPPSFAAPSMVLPPLIAGLAWGLTAQGWSPVPYDGPPLAPPSTSAQLAPPVASTPPSATTPRSTSPAITTSDAEPLPPCLEWLAQTAKADPRLGAAVVAFARSFEDERVSRAYLADALRRFGAAPQDFHERAAWIGRIAERDDYTRATMFSLQWAHREAESARVEFRAALEPHRATMPATKSPTTTTTAAAEPSTAAQLAPSAPTPASPTSTAPSAIPPPPMRTPPPAEARPTVPASSPPPTAPEPNTAAPSTSPPSATATAAQLDRWRTLAERDPQLAEALLRAAKGQDDARRAREHCARALAAHGPPPEGYTFETWAQLAAERDPHFVAALRTFESAENAREQSTAALRAAYAAHMARRAPSRARTAPSSTAAARPATAATTTTRSTSSTNTAAPSWLADVPEEVTARAEHEAPIARALGDLAAARQAKHEAEHEAAATIAPHGPPPVDAAEGGAWLAQLAATRPDVAAALAACSGRTAAAEHAARALAAALATPPHPSTEQHGRTAPPRVSPRPSESPPAAQLDARQLDAGRTAQKPTDNRTIDAPPIAATLPEVLAECDDDGKLDTAPPRASRAPEPSTHTDPRPRAARRARRTFQPRTVRPTRRMCSRCAPDRPCTRRRRPRRARAARATPSA